MLVEDVNVFDVKDAFEKVIKDINSKKTQLRQNRKELRNDLYKLYEDKERNKNEISIIQEKFEETTYKLKAVIEISRMIEDTLFKYDIEIEKED
jgi:prefoldin subunit 5